MSEALVVARGVHKRFGATRRCATSASRSLAARCTRRRGERCREIDPRKGARGRALGRRGALLVDGVETTFANPAAAAKVGFVGVAQSCR
ncbi:MAG: hypothetical protein R2705_06885 [Ilumatobacteraceae bacterium]